MISIDALMLHQKFCKKFLPELNNQQVALNGIVLKPNMVISGMDAANRADIPTVASATVKCLSENVPDEVPGIAFLSGGQTSEEATAHLSSMNEMGPSLAVNILLWQSPTGRTAEGMVWSGWKY